MISFVIPTRNEPEIQILLKEVKNMIKNMKRDFEVIVIDCSEDDTPLRAESEGASVYPQQSKGLGGALLEGFKLAGGDLIFTMDADLSHDPVFIPNFIKGIEQGYDIIVGSRKIEGGSVTGWGLKRRATSRIANILGRYLADVNVSDLTSGYRVYKAKVIKSLDLSKIGSSGYAFQLEVLFEALRLGFKVGVTPISFRNRVTGESKLQFKDILEFLKVSFRLFIRRLS